MTTPRHFSVAQVATSIITVANHSQEEKGSSHQSWWFDGSPTYQLGLFGSVKGKLLVVSFAMETSVQDLAFVQDRHLLARLKMVSKMETFHQSRSGIFHRPLWNHFGTPHPWITFLSWYSMLERVIVQCILHEFIDWFHLERQLESPASSFLRRQHRGITPPPGEFLLGINLFDVDSVGPGNI